jgi:hypothetical protein
MGLTGTLLVVVEKSPLTPLCQRGGKEFVPNNPPLQRGIKGDFARNDRTDMEANQANRSWR